MVSRLDLSSADAEPTATSECSDLLNHHRSHDLNFHFRDWRVARIIRSATAADQLNRYIIDAGDHRQVMSASECLHTRNEVYCKPNVNR